MEDTPLLASLLKRMNENQLALGQLSRSCQTGLSKQDLQKWHRTFEGHWIPWMEMQDLSPLRLPHLRQKVERRSNYSAECQHISNHLVLLYLPRKSGQK
ncbi:hypothetical protein C4J84_0194 [Pseudomonas sp. R11-23-07]|nr:hypothetical protein C4J84_0194 [Pseudomonas sp. R11-23-07]